MKLAKRIQHYYPFIPIVGMIAYLIVFIIAASGYPRWLGEYSE